MKPAKDFILERMYGTVVNEAKVESEKDFREWARAKFEEVFGDKFDEEEFKKTVDGFLEENKNLVKKGEWGELVGMMNQSFAPDNNKE